jgi:hypothetical protein
LGAWEDTDFTVSGEALTYAFFFGMFGVFTIRGRLLGKKIWEGTEVEVL